MQALVSSEPELALHRLAKREGRCRKQMAKLLRVTWLSPRIVEAILEGRQPQRLTRKLLMNCELPNDWKEQAAMLGFEAAIPAQ